MNDDDDFIVILRRQLIFFPDSRQISLNNIHICTSFSEIYNELIWGNRYILCLFYYNERDNSN